jgi:hypothetical protein
VYAVYAQHAEGGRRRERRRDDLVDRAVRARDEHAIVTEAYYGSTG